MVRAWGRRMSMSHQSSRREPVKSVIVTGTSYEMEPARMGRVIILAATPIGNLGDASRRLIEALGRAEVIASEDTRTAIQLLSALGIENRPRLIALHKHNEAVKAAEIVELARDSDVLVLS